MIVITTLLLLLYFPDNSWNSGATASIKYWMVKNLTLLFYISTLSVLLSYYLYFVLSIFVKHSEQNFGLNCVPK